MLGGCEMPKINLNRPCRDPLLMLLRGYGVTGADLGAAIGRNASTGCSRMRDPGTITVAELRAISRVCDIPIDELRRSI